MAPVINAKIQTDIKINKITINQDRSTPYVYPKNGIVLDPHMAQGTFKSGEREAPHRGQDIL